jgi:spermidine synthase
MTSSILYVLAFGSGAAALVYQVAWSRMISLAFGSSTLAVSTVVAGFLGGMGVGAWLYHRWRSRVDSAIRAYGLLEIGIGATAGLLTLALLPLPRALAAAASSVPPGGPMTALRIVAVLALLLVPSALMGATFPALCESLLRSARAVDRRLGWIYGLNTLGAATGALAAGFLLIEKLGASGSVAVAVALNLGVGGCALALARASAEADGGAAPPDESLPSRLPYAVTGLVLFGAGFATLGYEIVWFRALHYLLGNGTYVLSTALVIFLVGLGAGSFLYVPAVRRARPEWSLGMAQLAVAALAILAIWAEQLILTRPELSLRLSAWSAPLTIESWRWRLAIGFGTSLLIMLPATVCMGLTFPLASRLFLGSVERLGPRVGLAYLISNLGSIAGAIAAAVWILPALGSVGGTRLLAAINLVLAAIVLIRVPARAGRIAALGVGAVIVVAAVRLPPRLAFDALESEAPPNTLTLRFEEESDLGTVQVYEQRDRAGARAMAIDGTVIGVSRLWSPDLYSKQRLLAHLPMQLDRNIRRALNLGVATATTLRTLSRYDWIETLDAVEINPAVVHAGTYFEETSVFDDPRTTLHVEDAVHFLLRSRQAYDLIVSDAKQHVRFGGNAKVLSAEFYEHALDALGECGLFIQFWPLLYSPDAVRLMMRTFASVFPETELFLDAPNTLLVVGSRCPVDGRVRPTVDDLARSGVLDELEEILPGQPTALPSLWIARGEAVVSAIGDGPINDWNRLPLEFLSYRMEPPQPAFNEANLQLVLRPGLASESRPTPGFVGPETYEEFRAINLAYLLWLDRDYRSAQLALQAVLDRDPVQPFALRARGIVGQPLP